MQKYRYLCCCLKKKKQNLLILPEQENSELLVEAFENPESTPVHLPRQADDKSSIIRKSMKKVLRYREKKKISEIHLEMFRFNETLFVTIS